MNKKPKAVSVVHTYTNDGDLAQGFFLSDASVIAFKECTEEEIHMYRKQIREAKQA